MDAKIGQFFDSVGSFFNGGDNIPWCDRDIIAGCEREVADAAEETKNESLMRLSWALVHSRQPEDVNRGIAMLEASLDSGSSPLQLREKFYLLAVGHYRNGDYPRSRQLLERCLEFPRPHAAPKITRCSVGMPPLRPGPSQLDASPTHGDKDCTGMEAGHDFEEGRGRPYRQRWCDWHRHCCNCCGPSSRWNCSSCGSEEVIKAA